MFAGRAIVTAVLRRAVVNTSASRSLVVPALAIFKNVNQTRISTNIFSKAFSSTEVEAEQNTVYIGNLPPNVTERELSDLIASKLDRTAELRINLDKKGYSRGFGLIKFKSAQEAAEAVKALAGLEAGGIALKVDIFVPVPGRKMKPAAFPDAVKSSLFIGNLDFTVTEQTILDMCDEVLGPDIALRARIATDRDTGRSKGFAHVDFATLEHAEQAVVEFVGVEILGRAIRVDHAAKKSDSMNRNAAPPLPVMRQIKRTGDFGPTFSIFLGNLSWDVTPELVEDMLNDVLGPGLFTQVRLAIDRETGRQRGFGHVDFISQEAAARAVKELDGLEVMGRQLRADHAAKKESAFSGNGRNNARNENW